MKLIKLEAVNLATYDSINIDFTKLQYPTFVEGRTGAGKTTLFVDAITAALYGAAYGHKLLLREIVMKGKKSARITLTFEVNGQIYQVERIIYSTPGESGVLRVYKIDKEKNAKKPLSYSTRESERLIEQIVGLTYRALIASTVVRQGDVYGFLDAKPSERRDLIMEMLKLGIFERYKEKAKKIKDEKEKQKKRLEGELTQLRALIAKLPEKEESLEKLEAEIPKLEALYNEKEIEIQRLEGKLIEKRKELENIRETIGALTAKKATLEEFLEQKRSLEREIRDIEEELKLLPTGVLNELDELSETIYKIESIKKDIDILEQEIKQIKDYKRELEQGKQYREMAERIKKKLEETKNLVSDLDELKDQRSKLLALRDETLKHLQALKEGKGVCPVCGRPLTEEIKVAREKELKNEIANLEERIKKLNEAIENKEELKSKIENLNNKYVELMAKANVKESDVRIKKIRVEDLEEKQNRRVELVNVYNSMINKIRTLLNIEDVEEAREKIKALSELKKRFENIDRLKSDLSKLNERIKALNRELERFSEVEEERNKLEKEINEISNNLQIARNESRKLQTKLTELKSKIEHLKDEIRELKDKKRELEEKESLLAEIEEDIKALNILANKVFAPSELPTKLLDDYLHWIEEFTNRYLEAFGQDIRIRFKLEKRGERSQIQIKTYHQSYERDPNTFSGGERTLIGFSLRLAIGKLVSRIQTTNVRPRFLIIDEGFGPLDEELRIKVADALTTLLEMGEFEQIIVISHHRELRESPMFKTVIRIEKRDGKSYMEIE